MVGWREAWKASVAPHQSGVLRTYADQSNPPARARFPMRVGGRKLSVMRKFSGAAAALWLAGALSGATAGEAVKYKSPELAFEQGLGAYKSGFYEMAIPALEQTVAEGTEVDRFFAEFYLARIYPGAGALSDHAKAYRLYQTLANENADTDPEDGRAHLSSPRR